MAGPLKGLESYALTLAQPGTLLISVAGYKDAKLQASRAVSIDAPTRTSRVLVPVRNERNESDGSVVVHLELARAASKKSI